MAISSKFRFEILQRDSFICQYCGDSPPNVVLHVDHIDPVSRGGEDHETNLITACSGCNLGKLANPLKYRQMIQKRIKKPVKRIKTPIKAREPKRLPIDQFYDQNQIFGYKIYEKKMKFLKKEPK